MQKLFVLIILIIIMGAGKNAFSEPVMLENPELIKSAEIASNKNLQEMLEDIPGAPVAKKPVKQPCIVIFDESIDNINDSGIIFCPENKRCAFAGVHALSKVPFSCNKVLGNHPEPRPELDYKSIGGATNLNECINSCQPQANL